MSRVRRLSIRGLRNFGSESEEATFRFSRPLTLILGPNGTGKTTIIEALKFVTTGEFPPDSDKGKAFVHDPVFSTTNIVRCAVKAEVIDSVGDTFIISRTLESGKNLSKPYIKTLDNCITRRKKGSTQQVSVTNRCIDTDSEVAVAMGVTKPILKYVMFCHQEELNWPFDTPKSLKEKFDEIFDSTKFNKALENLSKNSKQLQGEIRVLACEVRSCEILVEEVRKREEKIKYQKGRLEEYEKIISDADADLKPLAARLEHYAEAEENYTKLAAEAEKKSLEYKLSNQAAHRLRDKIINVFAGTTEELKAEIDSYDNIMIIKSTEITELGADLHDINKEEAKIRNILAAEKVNIGTFGQQIKDHEKKVRHRNDILNEALSSYNLSPIKSEISRTELKAQAKKLEEKLKETEEDIEKNRRRRDKEEECIQKEVDEARSTHSKIESEKDVKKRELIEVQKENADIKSEIRQIGITAVKMNSLESKKLDAENKIQKLNNAMDSDVVKQEIQLKITVRNDLESKLNKTDLEITSLHKQSSLQNELEFNKSALEKIENEMIKIQTKQEDNIKMIIDAKEIPKRKLKPDIDRFQEALAKQMNIVIQEIQSEEFDLSSLETAVSYNKRELLKKQNELKSDKERISSVCNYKEYDEALLLQGTRVKDLQDRRGMYAHQSAAYKEYMKQLKETDPCCPLCHRGFAELNTVQKLLQEMEIEMENHPNRLKKCETELKIQQEQYDKMLQLKPVVEKVGKLEGEELEKLRDIIEKTSKKITQKQLSRSELQSRRTVLEHKVTKVREIMDDIIMWDRCIDDMSKLTDAMSNIKARLTDAGVTSERTIDEAQTEKENIKNSLQHTRIAIENMQLKLNVHTEQLQDARSAHNALHEQLLKIQADMQKLKQMKDQQETLSSKEIALQELITMLQDKELEADSELKSKILILELTKKENKEKNQSDSTLILEARRRLSEFNKVQNEVETFLTQRIYEALARSESKIQKYEQIINDQVKKKTDIEERINKLKADLSSQEVRKLELADNIQLKTIEETTDLQKKQCSALKEKLKGINIDKIRKDMGRLQELKDGLLQKKNMATGNRDEVERTITQYTDELRKEIYRSARKHYRKKFVELTVQREAIEDLKVCSKILDTAMLNYHEQRMKQINATMSQLWKHVYKGRDTTSLAIRTEPTEGVGGIKRAYNYKLVQTKHCREMDMRGRCSAGQKVLASIIIRLALAQTFSSECGILALDEPTTNLDEENANSLANALAAVVKLRSQQQKNFQLIVISHDEKFLSRLADLNDKKQFYELYRNHNGLTAVKLSQFGGIADYILDDVKQEASSDEEPEVSTRVSGNQEDRSHCTSVATTSGNLSRKRISWDRDDEDAEPRPQKKRYVFKH